MGDKRGPEAPLAAKITRPTYEHVLPRKRLFKQIDQSRKKSVLWVSGPAGSGKTTLISSYIDDRDLPCLWYQVDEGDDDASTFFYYLGFAVKQANRRKRRPMPLLTPEYMMGGIPAFSRRFFAESFSRLKAPSLVVFDNYQQIAQESPTHDIIREGLDHVPEHITVIFVSREKPPVTFSRMRANDRMSNLDWESLRLSISEMRSIAKLRGQQTPVTDELLRKTDGWIAGLILILEGRSRRDIEAASLDELHTEEVFEYFAGEVFRKTDAETRQFLMKTSFLPHMTSDMAEAVIGTGLGRKKLADLSRRNLFVMKRHRSVATYQYHPLFKHFLNDHAEQVFEADEIADILRRSAAVLSEKGETEEAARLFIETGQWEQLAGLIMRDAQSLLTQGRFGVLAGWLEALPQTMIEGNYWLRFFTGATVFPRDPSASMSHFEGAYRGFIEVGDAIGAFLSWSGVVEAIIFRVEDLSELDSWIPRHEELSKRFGDVLPQELKDRVTAAMYTALLFRMADHPDFAKWETKAVNVIYNSQDMDLKAKLLFHYTVYLQDRGDFSEAESILTLFRGLLKNEEVTPLASLFFRLAYIHQMNFTAHHDECLQLADETLKFARDTGVHVLDTLIAGSASWDCLLRNDFNRLRYYLTIMEESISFMQPFCQGFYRFLKAFEALEAGDLQSAKHNSDQNIALSLKAGYVGTTVLSMVFGAHVAVERGDFSRAQRLLSEADDLSRHFGKASMTHGFNSLLTKAYYAFKEDSLSAGYTYLRDALELGKKKNFFQSYIWRPRVIAELCVKAIEAGIEPDYVKKLITRERLIPEIAPVHLEDWPWPLRIYTFGRFGILRDDKPVKTVGRAQKKPMEMLKVLISLGGRHIRKESITDILWPDASGDDAHNAFTTTLSRLRKILGLEGAIELSEGKVTLMPNICWVDIWAFERLVGDADKAWQQSDNDRAMMLAGRAFAMYSGPFLSGESEYWPVSVREKLKSKFLRNVFNLGRHLEEGNLWAEALAHYIRGLEVDELVEEFYRRAMICCINLDRRAEALSIYNRCSETLERVLDIQPSHETKELFRRITS